jgi:DNA-binding FadR family transcriptional regulator
MDAAIETMAEGLQTAEQDRGERYIDGDLRFHLAIAEATRNGLILHSMRAVRDVMRRALLSIVLIPGSPEQSLEQHRSIRKAIADRDGVRARAEMLAHLVRVESDVDQAIFAGVVSAVVDGADG